MYDLTVAGAPASAEAAGAGGAGRCTGWPPSSSPPTSKILAVLDGLIGAVGKERDQVSGL